MNSKKLVSALVRAFVVVKCPSCGAVVKHPGTLCEKCLAKYGEEKETPCAFCEMRADVCVCSTRDLYFCKALGSSMRSFIFYDKNNTVFSSILFRLKRSSDRNAEIFFARELSSEIMKLLLENGEMASEWCVTYPPRSPSSVRKYGFDQSKGLAKRVAAYTGMKFEDVFERSGSALQKTLDAGGRRENAASSLGLSEKAYPAGKKYMIIDDVITTGSTVGVCQSLLLGAKAKAAFPVSCAKTPQRGAGYDGKLHFRPKKRNNWFS